MNASRVREGTNFGEITRGTGRAKALPQGPRRTDGLSSGPAEEKERLAVMIRRSMAAGVAVVMGLAALSGVAMTQPRPANPPTPAPTPARPSAPLTGVQRFEVRPSGISRIAFTSDAPLETIEGVSTSTAGNFTVDLANPSRRLEGSVTIPTNTLRTGNDMRDEHLRGENWLNATANPNIALALTGTDITTALTPGGTARGNVRGRLTLHGQTREVTVPVTVSLIPLTAEHAGMDQFGINADMLRVRGELTVRLSDYGVSIFAPLRLKVSNEIRVRVDLTTFRQAAPQG